VAFRFVSFRFVSFRFVSFRLVSFPQDDKKGGLRELTLTEVLTRAGKAKNATFGAFWSHLDLKNAHFTKTSLGQT
jgi:hypothetical protein